MYYVIWQDVVPSGGQVCFEGDRDLDSDINNDHIFRAIL